MSEPQIAPLRLEATDLRRVPMLGIALGIAIAATVLGVIETGTFSTIAVAVMWIVVLLVVLSVLPVANTLTLTSEGFRIRVMGVFTRFVPWSQVRSIETGEGWAASTLIVELAPEADGKFILGLPHDPTLGKRAFADSYGCDPEELATLMVRHRTTTHP